MPGDTQGVVGSSGDLAGDERAVPVRVVLPGAGDEALAFRDLVLEVRMLGVDAGVEDGDADARRRLGTCDQASNAWIRLRYHWRKASGSFGVNVSRRDARIRSTQATPVTDERPAASAARDGEGERPDPGDLAAGARLDPLCDEPCGRAPVLDSDANRAAEAEPGAANASRKIASARRLMPVPPSASGSRPGRSRVREQVAPGSRPGRDSARPRSCRSRRSSRGRRSASCFR